MEKYPFVSVIITTRGNREVLEKCLDSLAHVKYPQEKFEIILVPRKKLWFEEHENIKILYGVDYAHSRNQGAKIAQGSLLAFLDDDCIVPEQWLSKAVSYFFDPATSLIGGSALPFLKDKFSYRVGGYLLASQFVCGFASSRYRVLSGIQEAKEYSLLTANNVMRKDVFEALSGFDVNQAPSEENDLYFRLKKQGYKLLYVPEIWVWHRAKPIFLPIAKRIFTYGAGRGVLILRKPETIRIFYLIPVFFVLLAVSLFLLSLFFPMLFPLFFLLVFWYGILNFFHALLLFVKQERHPLVLFSVFLATPLIHFAYGIGVLYGMVLYFSGDYKKGIKLWTKE